MQGHQNHALAIALGLLEMLQSFDMGQARQALAWPPPTHGHFKEGNAGGGEVFLEQTFAFVGSFLGKTQLKVTFGDAPTVAGDPIHAGPQHTTNAQQPRIRQLDNQPQQP
ncbi:hypothetical protein D3C81_2043810 [compost metagenome]